MTDQCQIFGTARPPTRSPAAEISDPASWPSREAGARAFSLPDGESQGENRDGTWIIADYAFPISRLVTRHRGFSDDRQGNFDDGLTPKSGKGECRKMQFVKEKNDQLFYYFSSSGVRITQFMRFECRCQHSNEYAILRSSP